MSAPVVNAKLAEEIISFFSEDQRLIHNSANVQIEHKEAFEKWREAAKQKTGSRNFWDSDLMELWAAGDANAPAVVKESATFNQRLSLFVMSTIATHGWPTRAIVGDQPAAMFFFLFGHMDNANPWRKTQLGTIEEVCTQDGVNPRLRAHLRDRLASVAGEGQIYGSVMGPSPGKPGEAELYWKLEDDEKTTDQRRIALGLPTMEEDLQKFRSGAKIGQYMTPMTEGMNLGLDDVYHGKSSITSS